MVHGFSNKGVSPYRMTHKASHTVKVRHKIFRIFLNILVIAIFVSATSSSTASWAFETTKASALQIEEMRAQDLSFTRKAPQPEAEADPCLSLLNARRLSPGAATLGFDNDRLPVGNKTATPVALGLVMGIRIALGSNDIVKPSRRVQIGPEIRTVNGGGDSYALSIAAYRACKNEHALSLLNNNNK